MGRHRLTEDERKVPLNLKVKKKYLDALREKGVNISKLFEEFVKEYLKK